MLSEADRSVSVFIEHASYTNYSILFETSLYHRISGVNLVYNPGVAPYNFKFDFPVKSPETSK